MPWRLILLDLGLALELHGMKSVLPLYAFSATLLAERQMVTFLVFISSLVLGLAVMATSCVAANGDIDQRVPLEVRKRAESEGSVRVIVELKVGPGGIRAAQEEVLDSLRGTVHRVTRRFTQIPFLALEVSPEALRLLSISPAVLRIQEDRVVAPQEEKTP